MERTFISAHEAKSGESGDPQIGSLPKWDLSSLYLSFDSPEYRRDLKQLPEKIAAFLHLLETHLPADSGLAAALLALIRAYEEWGISGKTFLPMRRLATPPIPWTAGLWRRSTP